MLLSSHTKGALALLVSAFTYATFSLLIREMATMFSDNAQVAFRFFFAFVFLIAFALLSRRTKRLTGLTLLKTALLGLAFSGVVLLFTVAVNLTTIGNTVFLTYGGSIIAALLIGTFVFREKLTPVKVLAVILSLIGLAMYSSAILSLSLGIIAALGCGLLDGVANSIRKTLGGVDRSSILLYQYGFGSLITLIVLACTPQGAVRTVSLAAVVIGLIFAALLIGLGNLLLYGFQHFDVNVGTIILATELVFASLMGWAFYQEIPTPNEIVGGVMIFAASILSAVDIKALVRQTIFRRPLDKSV